VNIDQRPAIEAATARPAASRLIQLLSSPSLRTSVLFGLTGVGFVGANLVLAKILTPEDYALIALVVAIMGVAVPLGPLGIDGVVNRSLLGATRQLLFSSMGTSLLAGVASYALAIWLYDVGHRLAFLVFLGVAAGGVAMVAAAVFQRYQRLTVSLLLAQNGNFTLVLAAVAMAALGAQEVGYPVAAMAIGYVVAAFVGWTGVRHLSADASPFPRPFPWRDALHYAGVTGAGLLFLQLDRLLIPTLLSLEDLATFGVLAAVAIAPFRMLQMGVAFSMLPRLRAAPTVRARRNLALGEMRNVGAVTLLGSIAVLLLVPWLLDLIFDQRYEVSQALLWAAVIAGVLRVLGGFSRGLATALCTTSQMGVLNTLSWLSIVVAMAGAAVGARWGLVGLIYGTTVGWIVRVAAAGLLVRSHLTQHVA
jgi:O-antigen/teichoic acid export membrane protein